MMLTTYDVDLEIQGKMIGLEYRHTDRETGRVDWDAYAKEQEEIIGVAWKKQGEIMKMQWESEMEDLEAKVDADIRHTEFMCSQKQHPKSGGFPLWAMPALILAIYFAMRAFH